MTPSPAPAGYHGLEEQEGPINGSALATFDLGIDLPGVYTVPNPDHVDNDVHQGLKELAPVVSQMDAFLTEGVVKNFCSGPCDPD